MTQNQQAKELFLKTNLTKDEIATILGLERKTVHYWMAAQNWDRIKLANQHMPSIMAENTYLVMNKIYNNILHDNRSFNEVNHKEIRSLDILSRIVNRTEKRTTLNEAYEVRNNVLEFVFKKSPELAILLEPIYDEYLEGRAAIKPSNLTKGKLNERGSLIQKDPDLREQQLDVDDHISWSDNPPYAEDYFTKENSHTPIVPTITHADLDQIQYEATHEQDVAAADEHRRATMTIEERIAEYEARLAQLQSDDTNALDLSEFTHPSPAVASSSAIASATAEAKEGPAMASSSAKASAKAGAKGATKKLHKSPQLNRAQRRQLKFKNTAKDSKAA